MTKRIKLLLVIGGTIIVALILLTSINRADAALMVLSAPDRLQLSYDGVRNKNIKSKEKIPVYSGEKTLTFTADGFTPHTVTINAKKGEVVRLLFAMKPETEEARRELSKEKYAEIFEGLAGRKAAGKGRGIEEDNPILQKLPYQSRWISITPCTAQRTKKPEAIAICIKTPLVDSEEHIDFAFKKLKELDKNYRDYEIRINGAPMPTESEIREKKAIPCGEGYPSWCYRFAGGDL